MKALQRFAVLAIVLAGVTPAAAQSVTLEFKDDGRVSLVTQNAPISAVLAEWARRGKATIVNGERIPGPPITLELVDVPEQHALDVVLRSASGYLAAARETSSPGVSRYDRIYIVPTSRVTTTASVLPPPQPVGAPPPPPLIDDDDDNPPPPAPGQRVVAPPQTLPPGVRIPQGEANRLPPQGEEPAVGPQRPTPNNPFSPVPGPAPNPFGVQPGSSTPGVITPVPQQGPPRER